MTEKQVENIIVDIKSIFTKYDVFDTSNAWQ